MKAGAAPSSAFCRAVQTLRWAGQPLPAVRVFGLTFCPIVEFHHQVHQRRQRNGESPELDGDVLAMWEWPDYPSPPTAITLTGALFLDDQRRLRTRVNDAARWRCFSPSAVLTERDLSDDSSDRLECALHDIGLVCGLGSAVVVPAAPTPRPHPDRWVEEYLYGHALRFGLSAGRGQLF